MIPGIGGVDGRPTEIGELLRVDIADGISFELDGGNADTRGLSVGLNGGNVDIGLTGEGDCTFDGIVKAEC